MYRNAAYIYKEQLMRVFNWDENGKRTHYDSTFEPYVYLETATNPTATSIFNTGLKKVSFRNHFEKSKYLKSSGTKRIFENLPPTQQFLVDTYWENNETPEFSKFPIKTFFLDIETYSPDGFPNVDAPQHSINVITVYDVISKKFVSWGLGKDYTPKHKNTTYVKCSSEVIMLTKFIEFVEKDYPDILSGWNSEFFDIPYIINRINLVLGENTANRLSPVGNVFFRIVMGKFGKEQKRYYIDGVACIDYLDIYKRFTFVLRESYKLDAIAELELGESKVDYGDQSLWELADNNWDTFVDYNIQDVNLLVKLEDKLKFLELLRMLAYAGCTTFEAALGSLSIITGLCAIRARHKKLRIPTFIREGGDGKNEGAYVGEPQKGFQQHIVSFDANSLYPNVMITLNLSPETKIGKIISKSETEIVMEHVNGQTFKLSPQKFIKFIEQEKVAISKAMVLFSQKKKGIVPEVVDSYYQRRVEIKKLLKKAKTDISKLAKNTKEYKELKIQVDYLNVQQFTIKILINSIYGYFGNKHSSLGDDDIARSITLTGQAVIKHSNNLLLDFVKEHGGLKDDDLKTYSPIIYNDTDSSYVSIKKIIEHKGISLKGSDGKITKEYYDIVQKIEDHLNVGILE